MASVETSGFAFAPQAPNLASIYASGPSLALANAKPLSFQPVQSAIQIQPLAGWAVPNSHPEYVGQGIATGLNAITQGVQAGFERKWQQEDQEKKEKAELAKEERQHAWELKKEDLKTQHSKDLADFKTHMKGVLPGGTTQSESEAAAESHKFLQGVTRPGKTDAKEPQFHRDTPGGSIRVEEKKNIGAVTPGSILTPEAQQDQVNRQTNLLSSISIPGIQNASVGYQPAPAMAAITPPVIAPNTDISLDPKYLTANMPPPLPPGAISTDPNPAALPPINPGYDAATSQPAPSVQQKLADLKTQMSAPQPAMAGATSPTATPQATATPAPPQAVQAPAPAPTPAPTPALDSNKGYNTPSEIVEAFKSIKGPDTTEYDMPQYSVFQSPQDASLYASKFSNPDYVAYKVDSKPDKQGLYHVTWKNVRDARLKKEAMDSEHATKHLETAERLGRMNEAGIKAQIADFNSDPQVKLMGTRASQIPAFFNVSQMALSGDPHKSRRITDLDAIDSFVAFARGTQPTEAQYSEVQNYTQGYLADLRQKIDKGAQGARLSEDDIRTMRSLMVENFNGNANLINPDIRALTENYKTKHPDYRPEELPQEYKPLFTKEYMSTEISNAQRDMRQLQAGIKWASAHNKPELHAELTRRYNDAKQKQFEYDAELAQAEEAGDIPINWSEWTHSRRGGWMRGMHGGVPDTMAMPTSN